MWITSGTSEASYPQKKVIHTTYPQKLSTYVDNFEGGSPWKIRNFVPGAQKLCTLIIILISIYILLIFISIVRRREKI